MRNRNDPVVRAQYVQRAREWNKANIERAKEHSRKSGRKKRGLPEPTRPCPLVCECCGKPPGKAALALDHDHTTGKFRGWLCHGCNLGIGRLGDSAEGVQRALTYLRITSHS